MDDRTRAIQSIREAFAAIGGTDLSTWTDSDIERAVLRLAEVMGGAGLTVDEACRGLQWMGRPLPPAPAQRL